MSDKTTRQRNDGLRKVCGCARRTWAKCAHLWHFNFKWDNEYFRFSLERQITRIVKDADGKWQRDRATLGERITSKSAAIDERDRLRTAIREGKLQQQPQPVERPLQETLTLAQLMDAYRKQYIAVHRPDTAKNSDYVIGAMLRTPLVRPDGDTRAFGDWLVVDITTDVVEQYRQARLPRGAVGSNRHLELLRSLFKWATSKKRKLATDNPFRDGTDPAIKLLPETKRHRRLRPGEADRLLAACSSHLWAIVQAAIETGMRRGEIVSLQWWQVRFAPNVEIFLPAAKTKTKADRTIPVSTNLKAILDMRRHDLEGKEHPPQSYVFGVETGAPLKGFKRAWQASVLRANGCTPKYVTKTVKERKVRTALLTRECQERLRAIDLHFHDLRREAGSRWSDAGVPLPRIQAWLGHANISQTSTYLRADGSDNDQEMRRFEARHAALQQIATDSETGGQNAPPEALSGNSGTQESSVKHH